MIFRNYSEDSADESISSIKDLSSTKGEEDMDISDIEGSGRIEVVGEVNYGPETIEEWRKRLTTNLNEKFKKMNNCGKQKEVGIVGRKIVGSCFK